MPTIVKTVAKKMKKMRKALYKKDISVALKEISFGPEDKLISAVHAIDDPTYCINRAKEILTVSHTGGSKAEKRDQVIIATKLLLLSLILEPRKG